MKNPKPIRILVVDDHFMVRMGLSASLSVEPDMEVVAEAGTGEAALEAFRVHRPNLVIMDVRLPGMGGSEATAAILSEFPDAHVLMLSTHAGEEENLPGLAGRGAPIRPEEYGARRIAARHSPSS